MPNDEISEIAKSLQNLIIEAEKTGCKGSLKEELVIQRALKESQFKKLLSGIKSFMLKPYIKLFLRIATRAIIAILNEKLGHNWLKKGIEGISKET